MSGFDAGWLALREPADHRARDKALLGALRSTFESREAVAVVDLGCGTGSNLRAVAPHLPHRQHWRLIDHDPALLSEARQQLVAWADRAQEAGDDIILLKEGRELIVSFVQLDLAANLEQALDRPADLVTAAALFDLVSAAWIGRFAGLVASRRAAFYTALIYNGEETWEPRHAADSDMLAAFHAHQGRDKGFGASAGPSAADALTRDFRVLGYQVKTGASPWRLGSKDMALIRDLAKGTVQAVRETGRMHEELMSAWLEARSNASVCTIGHTDILALPR